MADVAIDRPRSASSLKSITGRDAVFGAAAGSSDDGETGSWFGVTGEGRPVSTGIDSSGALKEAGIRPSEGS